VSYTVHYALFSLQRSCTRRIHQKIGVLCGCHKVDNACPIKISTVASALRDSKTVMRFFRNREVPSGVLRSKREEHKKTERNEAASKNRKIRCIPTPKVRKITTHVA
jgi:hypothetical protein